MVVVEKRSWGGVVVERERKPIRVVSRVCWWLCFL